MAHIVVGLSGGVDSSVAAAQLIEAGHRVTGLFMKNWEEDDRADYCAAAEDLADAEAVCKQLGIELRTINFAHEYWTRVFEVFLDEYRNGRTPNPDVVCNREIKFKEFLDWAVRLGAERIATGHYARVERRDGGYRLLKGIDRGKDQSYFLHTLNQNALGMARFPLGDMHKKQVRRIARDMNLRTHDKKDSTGICFIGERRFDDFLSRYLPRRPGPVKTMQGETIGRHHGACYYTIGQRRGLGVGGRGDAWYVAATDVARNIVYATQGRDHPALFKRVVTASDVHWVAGESPSPPLHCAAQIRYRQAAQDCVITCLDAHASRIEFAQPQWAVAPGQSIVFYAGDACLGGGVIQSAED